MKKNKKILKNINLKRTGKKVLFLWIEYHVVVFMIFLVTLSAVGVYLLYENIHNYNWTEERKKVFLESKEKGVTFNEENFAEVVNIIDSKNAKYNSKLNNIRNIFQ